MRAPPEETVERWAFDYVTGADLGTKLAPAPVPTSWESSPPSRRLEAPGRPAELRIQTTGVRANRPSALRGKKARARLLHTFFHHELQAAELMCWALLAFPETPRSFREGLTRICLDEVRHMRLYEQHLISLGFGLGDFAARDWFWERVPRCSSAIDYVAVMGMGFEAGNLEHSSSFANRFRNAGDEEGARIQEVIGREEIAHVRFAVKWFEEWTGGQDFTVWSQHLPAPLSPMLMRGKAVDPGLRRRAGLSDAFIQAITDYEPLPSEGDKR